MASETKPVPQSLPKPTGNVTHADQPPPIPTPNQITLAIDREQAGALLESIDARLKLGGVGVEGAAFLLGLFSKIKSAMG